MLSEKKTYRCFACGVEGEDVDTSCWHCGKPRDSSTNTSPPTPDSWRCFNCLKPNRGDREICWNCGLGKGERPKEGAKENPALAVVVATSNKNASPTTVEHTHTATPTPTKPPPEFLFEVWRPDGTQEAYDSIPSLTSAIKDGKVRRNFRAKLTKTPTAPPQNTANSVPITPSSLQIQDWSTVSDICKTAPEVKTLFRPLSAVIFKGVKYGIFTGIILKAIDTTFTLLSASPLAAIIWLATIGSMFLPRRFGIAPILIMIFIAFQAGIRANFFIMAFSTALAGATFGAPAGAVVGSIIGHFKLKKLKTVMDVEDEGTKPYLLGLVLPAVFLAFAVPFYIFWLTPKFLEWAS